MKKIQLLLCGLYLIMGVTIVNAQDIQTRVWQDGTPNFQRIATTQNVRADSTISFIPLSGASTEPDSFKLILNGLEWSWPSQIRLLSAEDIDYRRLFNTDLYLVTDGAGRRVIEIDPAIPQVVWEFEGQLGTPQYLERPVDSYSYREGETRMILITDQGRHRVIKVIRENKFILWQYGNETEGNGFNQLSNPADAVAIPDSGLIFICDKGNNRVILVREADKSIAWNWGLGQLNNPVDIEYSSATSEVLITDQNNHRVIKVNYLTGNITWQFGTGLPDSLNRGLNLPSDADFLPSGNILICDAGNNRLIEVNAEGQLVWDFKQRYKGLRDADRLADNKHLIVYDNLPAKIGYVTTAFESDARDVGREVSFDRLYWASDTLTGATDIRLQLRSANTLGDLASAPWLGPDQATSDYRQSGSRINAAHSGHRFYQFRAILETNDPLYTPVLDNVLVTYQYYNTKVTGEVLSEVIRDPNEFVITKWKTIRFSTILPSVLSARSDVEIQINIIDPNTREILVPLSASKLTEGNLEDLSNKFNLARRQTIQLQALFNTNNSAATPVLNDWEVTWEATPPTTAELNFVDQNLAATSIYRVSTSFQPGQQYIDRVTVLLKDPNLIPLQNGVNLTIQALLTRDLEQITLNLQPDGWYLLKPSLPAIILETGKPDANDGFLQVFDRDTLVISYTDPITPTDQARDSVLIIQDVAGTIVFENNHAVAIDTAVVGDTIFVRVLGEKDRDLSAAQDSISLIVFDYETKDQQTLILHEVADSLNRFQTGEFLSMTGLPLVNNRTRINEDGIIQTFPGSRLGITYNNSISELPILQIVGGVIPPGPVIYAGGKLLDFDVAPNPFYGDRHNLLRIRVASSIGNLAVEKIEIFNFAGQKIKQIDGTQLYTTPITANQYSFVDDWWNLKDQTDFAISSGTYWVKLQARITTTNQNLSLTKKLVIIR
ncbi:MAG: hypothetical protein ONB16_09995 [candidate division KSB1 bacterium]|nr:hypothetical protein [candidate division KSB1 bacterium]MDZ7318501.1 hypothetical protein [candidate division KSB1 bacterium]MDZ7340014.1 hypothetical protein [candidate division KSB1 bacterium]